MNAIPLLHIPDGPETLLAKMEGLSKGETRERPAQDGPDKTGESA
jgi:hypothetical protein